MVDCGCVAVDETGLFVEDFVVGETGCFVGNGFVVEDGCFAGDETSFSVVSLGLLENNLEKNPDLADETGFVAVTAGVDLTGLETAVVVAG